MDRIVRTKWVSVDVRIAQTMESGLPLTVRSRLAAVGASRDSLAARFADSRLWEIWAPVVVVNVRPEDVQPDIVLGAATLVVEPHGALDGASALERRGLWDRHDGSVTVSSDRGHVPLKFRVPSAWRTSDPWTRRPSSIDIRFIRSVRAASMGADVLGGVRTRPALEAFVRAATSLSAFQLTYVLRRAEYAGAFTIDDVERILHTRRFGRGNQALRRAIELRRSGSAGTKSRSEDLALEHVSAIFGEPSVNVRGMAGIPTHEPDFCWPDRKWIVEIDGGHHVDDPGQRRADLATDELLRSTGWIVVRIPWRRVWDDMPGVIAELRAAFAG